MQKIRERRRKRDESNRTLHHDENEQRNDELFSNPRSFVRCRWLTLINDSWKTFFAHRPLFRVSLTSKNEYPRFTFSLLRRVSACFAFAWLKNPVQSEHKALWQNRSSFHANANINHRLGIRACSAHFFVVTIHCSSISHRLQRCSRSVISPFKFSTKNKNSWTNNVCVNERIGFHSSMFFWSCSSLLQLQPVSLED